MNSLHHAAAIVNGKPAATWPAWTDAPTWGLGGGDEPTEDDRAWWTLQQSADAGPDLDAMAEAARQMDSYEGGWLPC